MYKGLEAEKSFKSISKQRSFSPKKAPLCALIVYVTVVVLVFQVNSLKSPTTDSSWAFIYQLGEKISNLSFKCPLEHKSMLSRLGDSVTFLPLKDLRFANSPSQGHTWFMSSLNDTVEKEEAEYLYFPSDESKGRLLCVVGRHTHDGASNMYALAWPDSLPHNSVLLNGLTYVSDSFYGYNNIWHGLSAMLPFVGWYKRRGCEVPTRWILYHKGELRFGMGSWVRTLMEATYGEVHVDVLEGTDNGPICFEKAVVFRHNSGAMSREKRMEVFDVLRCKARVFCNVSRDAHVIENGVPVIGLTLLLRTGTRAFKNESSVIKIFERECKKVDGCNLSVARSDNLTFCDQVQLMTSTDILASPHGAQLTNMLFMDRNSSIMEFYPRGWLELAGVGQYVYKWEASWSGMRHEGAWRDFQGEECPYPGKEGCFTFYKSSKLGHNETFFSEWTKDVLYQVKKFKLEEASVSHIQPSGCSCV